MRNNLCISTLLCTGRIIGSCACSIGDVYLSNGLKKRARRLGFEICALWRTDGRQVRLYLMVIVWNKVEDLRNFQEQDLNGWDTWWKSEESIKNDSWIYGFGTRWQFVPFTLIGYISKELFVGREIRVQFWDVRLVHFARFLIILKMERWGSKNNTKLKIIPFRSKRQ